MAGDPCDPGVTVREQDGDGALMSIAIRRPWSFSVTSSKLCG
jgi:hypothetical protein